MKFGELKAQNFLTIANATVNLKDRGLQLIQGANDDDSSATSNGAGKSSLVDAVCWVLFGQTARGVRGDAVVNLGAKKDCSVSLVIESGVGTYLATRYRKHHTGKNTLVIEAKPADGEVPIDLSRGTDIETQKVLENILGCSYEVFIAAVYSGQEAMPDLPRMKDRELKQLIEEAAGMQRIEKAYELARERANITRIKLVAKENQCDMQKHELERARASLSETVDECDKWERLRKVRLEEAQERSEAANKALEDAQVRFRIATALAEPAAIRISLLDGKLAAHEKLSQAAKKADKEVRTAELAVDSGLLKRLSSDVKRYEAQINNAAEEVKVPCTECGNVTESMTVEAFIEHRQGHMASAKKSLEEAMVKARIQLADIKRLKEAAAAAYCLVPDVTAITAEKEDFQKAIKVLEDSQKALHRYELDAEATKSAKTTREFEVNPNASALEMCGNRVKQAESELEATEGMLSEVRSALEIANGVVKVFGPAGVRAQILDTVTPFLNSRTSDYLSVLSDGEISATWTTLTKSATGELKEKFTLDVEHKKGGDSFAALSGGEKRKVRLATALALQDLVASRATQPIDFWCGDEVDDALDPAGLERLMTILERKARERGTVLVISHSDLRDWVDDITTVRKTGQWHSVVEGVLCS